MLYGGQRSLACILKVAISLGLYLQIELVYSAHKSYKFSKAEDKEI